jgi:hypothetical protein
VEFFTVLQETLFATLWFSWIALIIAAVPCGVLALLLSENAGRWSMPVDGGTSKHKVHYLLLGLLGGLAGEFVAIGSLFFGEWWLCNTQHQLCSDGQGGMAFIVTIPALSFLGSSFSLLWTWMSLRIPAASPLTSVFRYTGPNRLLNWTCAIAIQFTFWSLLTLVVFRMTVM